jgi:hypothetical protein
LTRFVYYIVYLYVCMYVRMYVCIYIYVYTCVCLRRAYVSALILHSFPPSIQLLNALRDSESNQVPNLIVSVATHALTTGDLDMLREALPVLERALQYLLDRGLNSTRSPHLPFGKRERACSVCVCCQYDYRQASVVRSLHAISMLFPLSSSPLLSCRVFRIRIDRALHSALT